jgi:hypothetical protein
MDLVMFGMMAGVKIAVNAESAVPRAQNHAPAEVSCSRPTGIGQVRAFRSCAVSTTAWSGVVVCPPEMMFSGLPHPLLKKKASILEF